MNKSARHHDDREWFWAQKRGGPDEAHIQQDGRPGRRPRPDDSNGGGLTLSAVASEADDTIAAVSDTTNMPAATAGGFQIEGGNAGTDYTYANGVLTINNGTKLTLSTNGQVSDRIVIAANATATVALAGVKIKPEDSGTKDGYSGIDLSNGSILYLMLQDNTTNEIHGSTSTTATPAPGIHVPGTATLAIQGKGALSSVGAASSTNTYGANGIGGKPTDGSTPGETCGTVIILSTGNINISGGSSPMPDSNGTDIGGGKGSTDGGDGQGIRPVSGQKNTYTVWGELTLPAGVTIPEGAVLTGSGSLNEGSKLNQSAPGAPILSVTTSNSVTLKAPADAVSEKTLQYGYTTGSQSTDNIGWQDSSTFTGLTSGATYTFYARYKDDNFHKPSPPSSQGLEVTLKHDSTVTVAMGKGGLSTTTAVYGDTIMLKAAIAQVNATTRAATPNTVEFFVGTGEGKKSLGTADVTNNQATLSVTLSGENWAKGWVIGENTITSEYGGDDTMNGSSGTTTVTVNAAPLSAPDNVTLASSASGKAMAAWGAVTNASGYSVQLYKDSSAQGEAVTVDASKTSQEFTITEASSYTVKVKATGSRYYAAGPETESVSLTFHTVSFDTNDGDTAPDTQIIAQNSKATEPAKPSKAGYDFDGWWTSDDKQWKFDTDTVTSNMTLQAHWTQDTPAPPTPPTPTPSPTYQGIQVTGKPSRTEYEVGEELDLTGLVVREHWSDGSSRTLSASEYTVSGFDSSEPGEKTLTVTLKRDTNRTATFTVTVTAAPVTVHRLYNTLTGEHLYTANTQERDHLAANGWRYEGVAFTMSSHGTPVHRLYLPGGKHMFTTSETEYEHLKHTGWRDEGIAFHAPEDGATPVWRLYNPANGDHLLTTNPTERAALPTQNWRDEGTAFVSH